MAEDILGGCSVVNDYLSREPAKSTVVRKLKLKRAIVVVSGPQIMNFVADYCRYILPGSFIILDKNKGHYNDNDLRYLSSLTGFRGVHITNVENPGFIAWCLENKKSKRKLLLDGAV